LELGVIYLILRSGCNLKMAVFTEKVGLLLRIPRRTKNFS